MSDLAPDAGLDAAIDEFSAIIRRMEQLIALLDAHETSFAIAAQVLAFALSELLRQVQDYAEDA